jgi:hypothetical protein
VSWPTVDQVRTARLAPLSAWYMQLPCADTPEQHLVINELMQRLARSQAADIIRFEDERLMSGCPVISQLDACMPECETGGAALASEDPQQHRPR